MVDVYLRLGEGSKEDLVQPEVVLFSHFRKFGDLWMRREHPILRNEHLVVAEITGIKGISQDRDGFQLGSGSVDVDHSGCVKMFFVGAMGVDCKRGEVVRQLI